MCFSKDICKIIDYIKESGFDVIIKPDCIENDLVAGRIDYKNKWIKIDEPLAYYALMTVAHEAGHLKSFLKNKDVESCCTKERREILAYLYGWGILKKFKVSISKNEWRKFHMDSEGVT